MPALSCIRWLLCWSLVYIKEWLPNRLLAIKWFSLNVKSLQVIVPELCICRTYLLYTVFEKYYYLTCPHRLRPISSYNLFFYYWNSEYIHVSLLVGRTVLAKLLGSIQKFESDEIASHLNPRHWNQREWGISLLFSIFFPVLMVPNALLLP